MFGQPAFSNRGKLATLVMVAINSNIACII